MDFLPRYLMFLGAFIAWISDEQKRIKIVALAIAAPAMVTTWSGGQKIEAPIAFNGLLVPSTYAQPLNAAKEGFKAQYPDTITEKDTWQQIQKGVGVFFGYGKQPPKYWVIVESYKDKDAAQQHGREGRALEQRAPLTVDVRRTEQSSAVPH